jgi:hypothetical protein
MTMVVVFAGALLKPMYTFGSSLEVSSIAQDQVTLFESVKLPVVEIVADAFCPYRQIAKSEHAKSLQKLVFLRRNPISISRFYFNDPI